MRRHGVEIRIVAGARCAEPDPTLGRLLARAHVWLKDIRAGRSLADLARRDGHSESYIRTRLPMAFLAPKIQAAILEGSQPVDLSAEKLVRKGIPLDWSEQERLFGFGG